MKTPEKGYYYFKFSEGNHALERLIEKYGDLTPNNTYPLAIYWHDWKAKDLKSTVFKEKETERGVTMFNSLSPSDHLFLFKNNFVYMFQATDDQLKDFEECEDQEVMIFGNYNTPKYRNFTFIKKYKRNELPDFFYRLNSNQKYNRKTILPLEETDLDIAKVLATNILVEINEDNYLDYISPLQFESLLSLLFYEDNGIPGTYRGGTMANIDLVVKNISLTEETLYQIKYKVYTEKEALSLIRELSEAEGSRVTLLHLGHTDLENFILGREWIESKVKEVRRKSTRFDAWVKNLFQMNDIFNLQL